MATNSSHESSANLSSLSSCFPSFYSSSQDDAVELVTQLKSDIQNEHIYEELKCDANKIVKQ